MATVARPKKGLSLLAFQSTVQKDDAEATVKVVRKFSGALQQHFQAHNCRVPAIAPTVCSLGMNELCVKCPPSHRLARQSQPDILAGCQCAWPAPRGAAKSGTDRGEYSSDDDADDNDDLSSIDGASVDGDEAGDAEAIRLADEKAALAEAVRARQPASRDRDLDGGPPLALMEEWVASSPQLNELSTLVKAAAAAEQLQAPVTEVNLRMQPVGPRLSSTACRRRRRRYCCCCCC